MTLVTYLHRHPKTGVYWFRRSVPPALRQAAGRREFLESLGTKDPQEAKRRLGLVARGAEARLSALRGAGGSAGPVACPAMPAAASSPAFTLADAEAIAARYADEQLSRSVQTFHASPEPRSAQDATEALRSCRSHRELWLDALRERDWRGVGGLADDLLAREGRPRPAPAELALLHHALVRAMVRFFDVEIARLRGDWPALAPVPAAGSDRPADLAAEPRVAPDDERQPDITLPELLARYHAERRLRPKVHDELRAAVARFGEVCGKDRPVRAIGKASVGRFKAAMLAKPRVLSRADAALPLPAIVDKFAGSDAERVAAATVGKALAMISGVSAWGVRNGYMDANPFAGMKPEADASEAVDRRGFTAEELRTVFGSPIYTGHLSARRWMEPGDRAEKDARFWLPLMGNYTGCRLEELGQALVSDVRLHDGVLALRIDNTDAGGEVRGGRRRKPKAEGGKSLKTGSSKRLVPVHPVLLAAGFEEYVRGLRARGERHLFPDLTPDRYGNRTAAFSKWMARLLDRLGLVDPTLVFHSFRHGFKSACRRADLPREVHDYLTGHSSGTVGERYGEEHLPRVAKAIARVTFPGVDDLFMVGAGSERI